MTDGVFFTNKRRQLTAILEPNSMSVLFSSDQMPRNGDQYYPYRQDSGFYYLCGIEQEKSILLIFPNCPVDRYREVLFLLRPNNILEQWEGQKLNKEQASAISGIDTVMWLDEFEAVLQETMQYAAIVYLNDNEQPKFNPDVASRNIRLGKELTEKYPFHRYARLAPKLSKIRQNKEASEQALIKKACDITASAFCRAMKFVKPGVYEYEIQAEIEHEFMINQANGNAFHPIIASGKNATFLHYHSNNALCKDGDLILLDFGCEYKNYSSDLSRTIPVNGKFSPRQKEVYSAVLKAYKDIIPLFKEGNSIEGIYKEIIPILEEEMIRLKLFTVEEAKTFKEPGKPLWQFYFPHGLSHHIGLDVHDPGEKQAALTAGMVVSCEPGIYIPKEQIGVRIETDLLITHDKPIDMFKDLPVETEEIEQIMLM